MIWGEREWGRRMELVAPPLGRLFNLPLDFLPISVKFNASPASQSRRERGIGGRQPGPRVAGEIKRGRVGAATQKGPLEHELGAAERDC